jgi:predicted alpha/beta superfamily hydrolase
MKAWFYLQHKYALLAIAMHLCAYSSGQFTLRIQLDSVPAIHSAEDIYIAGSFNRWDPGDENFKLNKKENVYSIDISALPKGVYEYKFTRGDWKKGEVTATGNGIENRLVKLASDTTVHHSISGWADDFLIPERKHTASANVIILDTAFNIPQLSRKRRIQIYLPDGYFEHKKRFPVLYMHDGQNLFDEYTAPFGEWGIDETLDSLNKIGKKQCIVVAIDNGPQRMKEYNPFYHAEFGEPEGEKYLAFIAKTLKPFIDKNYRTMPSKENTIIAGSSMGGMISYYAMLRYPAVFGKAGVFSPSFWIAPEFKNLTDSLSQEMKGQFFFFAGDLEGESMVADMHDIAERLGTNSKALIYEVVDPKGRHTEATWQNWFAEFYLWVIGNGLDYQVR